MTKGARQAPIPNSEHRRAYDEPIFTPATISIILEAVRRPPPSPVAHEELAFHLNEAVKSLVTDMRQEARNSPRETAKLANSLGRSCLSLLAACGLDETADIDHLYPALGPGGLFAAAAIDGHDSGKEAVETALTSVRQLMKWASAVEARSSARIAPPDGRSPNKGRPSKIMFLRRVGQIYLDVWGDIPTRSTLPTGDEDGPFLRFLVAVHNHVSNNVRGVRKIHSANALAAAWRRADDFHDLRQLVKTAMA